MAIGGMPVVRRRDQHHVHLFHLQQLAVVGEGLARWGALLLAWSICGAVDIAQRDHIHVAGLHEVAHVVRGRARRSR